MRRRKRWILDEDYGLFYEWGMGFLMWSNSTTLGRNYNLSGFCRVSKTLTIAITLLLTSR